MEILSITVSIEDKKLLYIKKFIEEEECKFSCHHFLFDEENQAELSLDEKGAIRNISPHRKDTSVESTPLSGSRSVSSNNNTELKFSKNSKGSVVIIDVESFLIKEESLESDIVSRSVSPQLPSDELEQKLIISLEKSEDIEEGLRLHVEKLVPSTT